MRMMASTVDTPQPNGSTSGQPGDMFSLRPIIFDGCLPPRVLNNGYDRYDRCEGSLVLDENIRHSVVLPEDRLLTQRTPTAPGENNASVGLDNDADSNEVPGDAHAVPQSILTDPLKTPSEVLSGARCRKRRWDSAPTQPLNTGFSVTEHEAPPAIKAPPELAAPQSHPPRPAVDLQPPHPLNTGSITEHTQSAAHEAPLHLTAPQNNPPHPATQQANFYLIDAPSHPLNTGFSTHEDPTAHEAHHTAPQDNPPLPDTDPQQAPFYFDEDPPIPIANDPSAEQNIINAHYFFQSTSDYQRFNHIPLVIFDNHYLGRINITGYGNIPIGYRPYQNGFSFGLSTLVHGDDQELLHYCSGIIAFPNLIDPNTFLCWIDGNYIYFQAPLQAPLQPHVPNYNNPGDNQNAINIDGYYYFQSTIDYQRDIYIPLIISNNYYLGRISITGFQNIPIFAWPYEYGFEFEVEHSIDNPDEEIFHFASGIISFPRHIDPNTFFCWIYGNYIYFQAQIL